MTLVEVTYELERPLESEQLRRLGEFANTYGLRRFHVDEEKNLLRFEYDASRLHEAEVLAAVRSAAIPVAPERTIPPGGLDYTGEFKDFAWPTAGLSPVNQKSAG